MSTAYLHTVPAVRDMFPTDLQVTDESLLADARRTSPDAVAGRVAKRIQELRDRGAERICCTCSTIGAVAEAAGDDVFRVDRPMAQEAAQFDRVGLVAGHESTIEPSTALLREANPEVQVTPVVDEDTEKAARQVAPEVDVIVLAQASIAPAAEKLQDLDIPVLNSPDATRRYLATLS